MALDNSSASSLAVRGLHVEEGEDKRNLFTVVIHYSQGPLTQTCPVTHECHVFSSINNAVVSQKSYIYVIAAYL